MHSIIIHDDATWVVDSEFDLVCSCHGEDQDKLALIITKLLDEIERSGPIRMTVLEVSELPEPEWAPTPSEPGIDLRTAPITSPNDPERADVGVISGPLNTVEVLNFLWVLLLVAGGCWIVLKLLQDFMSRAT